MIDGSEKVLQVFVKDQIQVSVRQMIGFFKTSKYMVLGLDTLGLPQMLPKVFIQRFCNTIRKKIVSVPILLIY